MTEQEAIAEIRNLAAKAGEVSKRSQMAGARYEAHMSLYNVAVVSGDNVTAESERLAIHSHLDAILDATYHLHQYQARIAEIQRAFG